MRPHLENPDPGTHKSLKYKDNATSTAQDNVTRTVLTNHQIAKMVQKLQHKNNVTKTVLTNHQYTKIQLQYKDNVTKTLFTNHQNTKTTQQLQRRTM